MEILYQLISHKNYNTGLLHWKRLAPIIFARIEIHCAMTF